MGNDFAAVLVCSSMGSVLSRTNSFKIRRFGFLDLGGGVGVFGKVGGRDELSVEACWYGSGVTGGAGRGCGGGSRGGSGGGSAITIGCSKFL